jgi:hypothetical protein
LKLKQNKSQSSHSVRKNRMDVGAFCWLDFFPLVSLFPWAPLEPRTGRGPRQGARHPPLGRRAARVASGTATSPGPERLRFSHHQSEAPTTKASPGTHHQARPSTHHPKQAKAPTPSQAKPSQGTHRRVLPVELEPLVEAHVHDGVAVL